MRIAFYAISGRRPGGSPDLAYVIGVMLGDGCCYRMPFKQPHPSTGRLSEPSWRIELQTVDEPFAAAFADALGRTVKRREYRRVKVLPPRAPRGIGRKPVFRVCVASRGFGDWWQRMKVDPSLLVPHIERHPAAFLRGLYDSEGNLTCASTSPVVRIFSNDEPVLVLAEHCLGILGLRGTHKVFRIEKDLTIGARTVHAKPLLVLSPLPAREFLRVVSSNIPAKRL